MALIVGLLRHGQTDWNIEMRLQGISDIEMNETGHLQAKTAARILGSSNWDRIVSSPLSRAQVTARYVADELGFSDFELHPLLIERSFGEAEGSSYEEWRERLQAGIVAKGAETADELESRIWELLGDLADKYADERVLTVSHGALIRKTISLVSGGEFPREGDRFGNTSLTTIKFDGTKWSIVDYNPRTLGS
ncbi:MAG: histidine phosphatase family protein [Micrococcales bacterium]